MTTTYDYDILRKGEHSFWVRAGTLDDFIVREVHGGDYSKVHRCAVISLESRAAQYDHADIAKAAKKLLELIDGD